MHLGFYRIDLYTLHAPGLGRVPNVIGSRADVAARLRDRQAHGIASPGERVSQVKLWLRFDGCTVHAIECSSYPQDGTVVAGEVV